MGKLPLQMASREAEQDDVASRSRKTNEDMVVPVSPVAGKIDHLTMESMKPRED